jgi:tetratricopeptide (TPR) repeat protein
MSLLLEALKRAEAAKQQGTPPGAGEPAPLTLGAGPQAEAAPPLMTRDRLPDITQPLEILSDDLPSSASARAEPLQAAGGARGAGGARTRELLLEADPVPQAPSAGAPASRSAGDKEAIKKLFEAKGVDYDPYRFIKIVVALAIGVVVAYGGYLYYQLQPRSAMVVNTTPPPPSAAPAAPAPVAVAPVAPAPADPAPAPAAASTPTPESAPAPATAAAATAPAAPAPAAPAAPAATRPAPPAYASASPPRTSAPAASRIAAAPAPRAASPAAPRAPSAPPRPATAAGAPAESPVDRGYRALEAGDLETARQEYTRALSMDRSNRDALLGLAAIDMRTQNYAAAEARYARVLEIDPRDPYAQAGMVTLRGRSDPVQAESRLKGLLATQPDANFLNFTLGNQYAAQSRWSEAQAAYFKAYTTDPDNPDFAYNLAVSLDQLRQPQLALEYYRKALAAAANRSAAFQRGQVESRIRELAQ